MNDIDWLHEAAGTPLDELPEEVKAKLDQDAELREALRAQADVARWMGLKRYEQPDSGLEARVRERVRAGIRNGQGRSRPMISFDAMPDWVRMAAAVVFMLGLSVLTHREMLRAPESGSGVDPAATLTRADLPRAEPIGPPGYLLNTENPFVTQVWMPVNERESFKLPAGLDPDVEAGLLGDSLFQTNRSERVDLLPVSLRFSP